jgi:quercetin dioxygenase-like cupin family protein
MAHVPSRESEAQMTQPDIHHIAATEGKTLQVLTDRVTIKLGGEETGGAYFLAEDEVPPQGGVPLHSQTTQETFYILAGSFEFTWQGPGEGQPRSISIAAGSVVHIPAGIFHSYRNRGEEPGRILFIIAPAGMTERFFEEIGTPLAANGDLPQTPAPLPDPVRLLEIMQKYGVMVGIPGNPDA